LALENEHLVVAVDPGDGTLTVTDRASGLSYPGLNGLRDVGDAGDTYNHSRPAGDPLLTWSGPPRLDWVEQGPARSTLRVTREWSLPAGLAEDRQARVAERVPLTVHSEISLAAGSRRVDIRTHFLNTARDHRLQATFPLGVPVAESAAESMFEVVTRPTALPADPGVPEPAVDEHPQQAFCSASDGVRGLTIANRGLTEYSCTPDGVLAVTLLRAVGWLSRSDLASRAGDAGPALAVPEAQCLGPVEARYSVIPHPGPWAAAASHREAHAFNAELLAAALRPQGLPQTERDQVPASLPPEGVLVEVSDRSEQVLVTAVKRAEDSERLLVRVLNMGSAPVRARVQPLRAARAAHLVDLRENELAELTEPVAELRPWQLATFAFAF
jgi:alpha-mannosidase